jgi:hypothetical protein
LCLIPDRLLDLRNSELQAGFGIVGLELHWSTSGKGLKLAEMPFMKSNGKSEWETTNNETDKIIVFCFGANLYCCGVREQEIRLC